tara:strand:- start:582 stop:1001 length:420 start_codon:yes stop_codon:yes gene_type:complete
MNNLSDDILLNILKLQQTNNQTMQDDIHKIELEINELNKQILITKLEEHYFIIFYEYRYSNTLAYLEWFEHDLLNWLNDGFPLDSIISDKMQDIINRYPGMNTELMLYLDLETSLQMLYTVLTYEELFEFHTYLIANRD